MRNALKRLKLRAAAAFVPYTASNIHCRGYSSHDTRRRRGERYERGVSLPQNALAKSGSTRAASSTGSSIETHGAGRRCERYQLYSRRCCCAPMTEEDPVAALGILGKISYGGSHRQSYS